MGLPIVSQEIIEGISRGDREDTEVIFERFKVEQPALAQEVISLSQSGSEGIQLASGAMTMYELLDKASH